MKSARRAVLVPYGLASALVVGSVVLLASTPDKPFLDLHTALPQSVSLVLLAIGFCAAELGMVTVEFRRQAYAYAPAGLPLALGLAMYSPRDVVAARVIGSVIA